MDKEQEQVQYEGASEAEIEIYYAVTYPGYEPNFSEQSEEECEDD